MNDYYQNFIINEAHSYQRPLIQNEWSNKFIRIFIQVVLNIQCISTFVTDCEYFNFIINQSVSINLILYFLLNYNYSFFYLNLNNT